jgi:Cu2+-exporting ATPase
LFSSLSSASIDRPTLPIEIDEHADIARCLHCGADLGAGDPEGFCCVGCRTVYALLHRENLDRYYDLRDGRGQPIADTHPESRDTKWLELVEARQSAAVGLCRVDLGVQGLHCTGCVWLLEELFKRHDGGKRALVNPTLGTLELVVDREFPLRSYVEEIERFGYVLGPLGAERGRQNGSLQLRMGVCVAIAMNSMIFAVSLYAGLDEGPIFRLFHAINFGLSIVSVAVGGSVFIRSSWQALQRGVMHLDLPIALGILLAFAGSTVSLLTGRGGASYFDTVNIFIALMLVGRWLQERVLEKNRAQLLESAGIDGLLTRRITGDKVEIVPVRELREGDALLVGPGDVVPVLASLEDDAASFSFDWITGESAPREHARGDLVPAGACVAGASARRLVARQDFAASSLVDLLRAPVVSSVDGARTTPWWTRITRRYVLSVLVASTLGFVLWMARTGDVLRALDVVTAILTVTCPCAIGIATPLAYEIVQAALRKRGLLIRSAGFLDRAPRVRRVVFDKTGTLTTGVLRLENPGALDALTDDERRALYNLAARSAHPKSIAVKRALATRAVAFDPALVVEEEAGLGLVLRAGDHTYRLGLPAWASAGASSRGDVAFSVDGAVRASLTTAEDLRPDAATEVRALEAAGFETWILSGDDQARVDALALAAGIPLTRAVGKQSPEAKAEWLRGHDHGDTLMLGDGINDSLAIAAAHCSGTPAIDRPFIAARSDFYLITAGLAPVRTALLASARLERVVRRILRVALAYNVLAVGLACAGLMSPLVCAVFMPASSLSIILATTFSLSGKGLTWK